MPVEAEEAGQFEKEQVSEKYKSSFISRGYFLSVKLC